MPSGAYLLSGPDLSGPPGPYAVEHFTCGSGPAGWRYTATREDPATGAHLGWLDLVLDAAGLVRQVHVEAGGWVLRGGVVGPECTWRRGHDEHTARASGFTGSSPAWVVATARLLRPDEPVRTRLVRVTDDALGTRLVDEAWVRTGTRVSEGLPVDRYEAADLATGGRRVVHLAGDLVLEAPGVRLLDLQP